MKYPNIKLPEGFGDKLLKIAAVGVGIYFLRRVIKKAAQESADSQIDTDPDAGHARALNAAMNPSGINWMRSFDTTNTEAIYQIAPQIISLDKVKDFYKAQTEGRVLHEDLIKEIGAEGYDKFLSLATKGKSGSIKYSPVRPDIKAGLWVVTSSPETYIRKTPEKKSIHWIGHNIIRLVKKGQVLGASTGKFSYDEKNDVTFIEFFTFGVKNKGKQFYWVAKSQVEFLTKEERAKRDKAGKMPLVLFAGLLGSIYHSRQAVTLRNTVIYNERFKSLSEAPRNIILGFPLLRLKTDKGTYLKVQTVQGFIRWVKQSDVRFQNRS